MSVLMIFHPKTTQHLCQEAKTDKMAVMQKATHQS
jgi:hypothetical protein